jgi:hypothetical protein
MKASISNLRMFAVAAMTALLCALGGRGATAEVIDTEGRIPIMTALTASDFQCLTTFRENLFAKIPNTSIEFDQGGSIARSVLVTFVAEWPLPRFDALPQGSQPAGALILLEIDGQRVDLISEHEGVLVHEGRATSVSNGTHGFTFVTRPIAPGRHVATIFWKHNLIFDSGTICVFQRSLVVQHR